MGNCINLEKAPANPEEKLCRDLINELKERRKNHFKENTKSKRKLKLQNSKSSKFFEDDTGTVTLKSWENTRDTFFAKSGESFQQTGTHKFFYPQLGTTTGSLRKNSAHSRNVSRNSTPDKTKYAYAKASTSESITIYSPNLVVKKSFYEDESINNTKSGNRSKSLEKFPQNTNFIYSN